MEAVAALYSEGHWEISLAILPSLSKAIFDAPEPRAATGSTGPCRDQPRYDD